MESVIRSASQTSGNSWVVFGHRVPKNEVVFFSQIIIVYIVIITSIVNLSIGRTDSSLWVALLSSSIGYILPNPTVKSDKLVVKENVGNQL